LMGIAFGGAGEGVMPVLACIERIVTRDSSITQVERLPGLKAWPAIAANRRASYSILLIPAKGGRRSRALRVARRLGSAAPESAEKC